MKTPAQRAAKRAKTENRKSKDHTWYCAGCNQRHILGEACPKPRLFAKMTNRMRAPNKNVTR